MIFPPQVPYKPKTPEIIDLDEYPETPQIGKYKKLDILKERGLEVTAIPNNWANPVPGPSNPIATNLINQTPLMLNPAMQHQIMTQAQMFQMYNVIPQNYPNGVRPPNVIQGKSIFGSTSPQKTVYGNPKDPFMPPPHILQGAPFIPARSLQTSSIQQQDALDLTCKSPSPQLVSKPAVEIVRVPQTASPTPSPSPQNLTKNYKLLDGKAVVGSNLEITLVVPKQQTPKARPPQKRSSNGKFVSNKTKDNFNKNARPVIRPETPAKLVMKNSNSVIPTYQIVRELISPTTSTSSRESVPAMMPLPALLPNVTNLPNLPTLPNLTNATNNLAFKNSPNMNQLLDLQANNVSALNPYGSPAYLNALYNRLSGEMKQRQMAMYRDLMAGQFRGYPGLPDMDVVNNTPTTNN